MADMMNSVQTKHHESQFWELCANLGIQTHNEVSVHL